ncbi:unnamed protein product, partial [Strongylus vulgaris]
MRLKDITAEECEVKGGEAVGLQCHFKPDVYMLSVLLTFGTFALAYGLNRFRNSKYFLSALRNALSDFGVVIAIAVMTIFSHMIGLDVPSLNVPKHFKPTIDRPWLVDIFRVSPVVAIVSFLPAAFYTILIVMDQQITAVIINRKDNMLRKGEGYHLDLFVIAILVLICSFLGLPFYPTIDRPWLVDISRVSPVVAIVSFLPAAFYTILIVMDQQITAVIINRKDNMLRKGEGYHLDLFVIAILVLICSFLGLPFYVAATVLSVMHVNSLRLHSETSAPGEVPRFLGVKFVVFTHVTHNCDTLLLICFREQRLSGFLAHFLIGLSVLLTGIIKVLLLTPNSFKLVPLPVLIGIFLYMGVVSLLGQQFVQRIGLLFTS